MPSPIHSTVSAVVDTREQPWKKILAAANIKKTTDSEENVAAGGPCDVLTNFFSA
jgi:hypothetical protein